LPPLLGNKSDLTLFAAGIAAAPFLLHPLTLGVSLQCLGKISWKNLLEKSLGKIIEWSNGK
jgi:hypothetical protein